MIATCFSVAESDAVAGVACLWLPVGQWLAGRRRLFKSSCRSFFRSEAMTQEAEVMPQEAEVIPQEAEVMPPEAEEPFSVAELHLDR